MTTYAMRQHQRGERCPDPACGLPIWNPTGELTFSSDTGYEVTHLVTPPCHCGDPDCRHTFPREKMHYVSFEHWAAQYGTPLPECPTCGQAVRQ